MDWPEPLTVNVPFAKLALPTMPTGPMSRSAQPEGRPVFAVAVTVSESAVVFDKLPEVPVMVTVDVPVVAVAFAVSVNVLVLVVLLGLKEAVTPLGRPEADKLTLPVKPFCAATVIVLVPTVPCTMLMLAGDAERE